MEDTKRDIRLYYYSAGQLTIWRAKKKGMHYFDDIFSAKAFIAVHDLKNRKKQWVIVEYFGAYDSKILEVI